MYVSVADECDLQQDREINICVFLLKLLVGW